MLVYSAIQGDQIRDADLQLQSGGDLVQNLLVWQSIKRYLITIPIVIAVVSVLMSIAAWRLYDEFAWTIYKHISADVKMKRRYLAFQVGHFFRSTYTWYAWLLSAILMFLLKRYTLRF